VQSKKAKTEAPEVTKFREYIRLKTVHPEPDYASCREWLLNYGAEIGLELVIDKEYVAGKPVLVFKLEGSEPQIPAVLLNSHVDVVPVEEDHWCCDPFSAFVDDEGRLYGRGTQDMKCVGIQHLEALRRIKEAGVTLRRTVYISFVPDEEIGGKDGMGYLAPSSEFDKLNIGLALDEGLAREDEDVTVFYGERHLVWRKVTFKGNPGHGSRFIEDTAVEKVRKLLNLALDYRAVQKKRWENSPCMTLGDVTTVNVNIINGGCAANVVPSEFSVVIDCRISHESKLKEFDDMFQDWINQAGGGEFEDLHHCDNEALSSVETNDPWWNAITGACQSKGITLKPEIFPAGTDSRYLRNMGIPAYGISPINNTPILLHDHNEWLGVDTFLKGIDVLQEVVSRVANV